MRFRSTLSGALALALLASLVLPCFDFCPDEEDGENCPPVCANCIGCPRTPAPVPLIAIHIATPRVSGRATADSTSSVMPLLADDILHVPLALGS